MINKYYIIAFLISSICIFPSHAQAQAALPDRLKLWEFAHDQCLPNWQTSRNPAPCTAVNISNGVANGYVIFPDRNGIAQFLLIPTRKITGIESQILQRPGLPDYWGAAWQARSYLIAKLGKTIPDDAIGLAVNSAVSRSQDQLHIHIDCLDPEVAAVLQANQSAITDKWSEFSIPLKGKYYHARRVADFNRINLFRSLTDDLGIAPSAMGQETIVVTAGDNHDFIALENRANPATGTKAHAEDLLDASCSIATIR